MFVGVALVGQSQLSEGFLHMCFANKRRAPESQWQKAFFLHSQHLSICSDPTFSPQMQDSLGRLADVHAIEEAQADTAAWAALSKECAFTMSTSVSEYRERTSFLPSQGWWYDPAWCCIYRLTGMG